MPELPELIVIAEKLKQRLKRQEITRVAVHNHLVLHGLPVDVFESNVLGNSFESFRADGKFLIMELTSKDIVVNRSL